MYDLPYYKEKDEQIIKEFVDQHPFAFLAGCDSETNLLPHRCRFLLKNMMARKY